MKYGALLGACTIALAGVAGATETTTYEYDAQGRLIKSSKAGGPASGTQKTTSFDPAGNRTNQTVTGASGSGGTASFAISNASATEGGSLTFTVTKTGSLAASVNYATANSSALAGSDYTASSGTLSFTSVQTSQTVVVATINDAILEPTETFHVNLSAPTGGATLSDGQGVGTIIDNDTANSPPNAVTDSGSMGACTQANFNLTANDTDPEGNYPLTIQSISGPLSAVVASASTVTVYATASTGLKNFSYVVRDSLGATSTGYLNVTVSGICF